ncbi:zinc ribbon domain-containing protein [Acidithiobacillus ferrianus]|uniref:Zinc ribbon domain-containing protein n=2 Tax=Acidithiobacillus ferrianus TaxID=2678518 RepID=A0A845UEX5_9PROT|nr:zinc ribbon domain-containing protein [Acidithiobacillus ferrianus]NDU42434.1 zinc ribbon domain-containing protein [Acidithiobacillus ferrianus]
MPIFDYHCCDCDTDVELLVMGSNIPNCPHCGGQHLEKQLSRVAAPGRSAGLMARGRAQAAKEGHLSHFSPAERKLR